MLCFWRLWSTWRWWKFARLKFNWIPRQVNIYTLVLVFVGDPFRVRCAQKRVSTKLSCALACNKFGGDPEFAETHVVTDKHVAKKVKCMKEAISRARRWYSTRRKKPIWIEAKSKKISPANMKEEGNDNFYYKVL